MTPDHDSDLDDRLDTILRDLTQEDLDLSSPSDSVWPAISDELGLESASNPAATTGPQLDEEDGSPAVAPVVSLSSRRRPTPWLLGAAAAVVVALIGFAVVSDTGTDGDVLATGDLAWDADAFDQLGADAVATAQLVERDGSVVIDLADTRLPDPDEPADLEVWLIQPDADGNVADLVSLGLVDPDDPESLTVPDDIDPDIFFVVDISVEPRDGDATHSGRSILRGALTSV